MSDTIEDFSHRRLNILTNEWVLVSPHRAKRPWQGQEETILKEVRPSYDESCYLCPGNTRINGEKNPDYKDTFVFTNDFSAIQKDVEDFTINEGLLRAESEKGICKVICFSADHSKTLADMETLAIEKVIKVWQKEYQLLGGEDFINYVQIFENKGAVMGCSNPHPHGQIWSQSSIPNEIIKKDNTQLNYYQKHKSSLLEAYLKQELEKKERIIYENDDFVVLVPYWAIWPYETMIAPKQPKPNITGLLQEQRTNFAKAISKTTKAYDKIFNCSFPYSSGIHQAPTHNEDINHWHWHMSFYPPLLRSASVKKFMVGYEMFGMPQRDITPEQAANVIKNNIH